MSETIYFDGVESVGVIGGNVRLELFRQVPDPQTSSNKRVSGGSLVMSLEGFLRTHQSINKLMEELKERNVVTSKPPSQGSTSDDSSSPNFAPAEV